MKKAGTKLTIVLTTLMLTVLMAVPVLAETRDSSTSFYLDSYVKKYGFDFYLDESVQSAADVKDLKSSNTKVATVSVRNTTKALDEENADYSKAVISIRFKKAGTATISYNYKMASGETIYVKDTFKAKKWVNPVKSLKIGSKEYKNKFKKDSGATIKKKSISKKKIKIKLKKGYKLAQIWTYSKGNPRTRKNGFKQKFYKGDMIEFMVKKGKNIFSVYFVVK